MRVYTHRAFTLIELLIVIAIIGLLSTLAIIALNSSRASTRDAKRLSDLKQISTALDLYYSDHNSYPATLTPGSPLSGPDDTVYLSTIPHNPSPRADGDCPNENYNYTSSGLTYSLYSCLGTPREGFPGGFVRVGPNGFSNPITYLSNFSSGLNGWTAVLGVGSGNNDGIAGEDDVLKFYANGTSGFHNIQQNNLVPTNKVWRLRAKVYIPSSNTTLKAVKIIQPNGAAPQVIVTTLNQWFQANLLITGHGAQRIDFQGGTAMGNYGSWSGANSSTDDIFYVKDIKIIEWY